MGRFGYSGGSRPCGARARHDTQAWLPELGLRVSPRPPDAAHARYYYKARIYSPTLGRFMQTGPIGYDDQQNLYAYVGNDPINAKDPTGMYNCNTENQCKQIESARHQIERAARREGLNLSRSAALRSILRTIGTQNDRNGVYISHADLNQGTLGSTTPRDGGGYNIELDFKQIREGRGSANYALGAAILAHEARHVQQFRLGDRLTTRHDLVRLEIGAYRAGAIVLAGLDVRGASVPSYLDPNAELLIMGAARTNCRSSVTGRDGIHQSRTGTQLSGSCQ